MFHFQVPIPNDTELLNLLKRHKFLHVSFQRKYFGFIEYRHHAILILNKDNEKEEFWQYEVGKGGTSSARKYIVFPSFQRTDKNLTDISKIDFRIGVHVCVYGKQNCRDRKIQVDYENVKTRAEECVRHYLLPFWSPMSPNCENFATKVMTGYGRSRQVERIGVFMRLLGDALDPCSFFEQFLYIVLFQIMEPESRWPYVSLIPEIGFLMHLKYREHCVDSSQLTLRSDINRNMFKYSWSFLFRWTVVFTYCRSSIVKSLATFITPIALGVFYDCFNR